MEQYLRRNFSKWVEAGAELEAEVVVEVIIVVDLEIAEAIAGVELVVAARARLEAVTDVIDHEIAGVELIVGARVGAAIVVIVLEIAGVIVGVGLIAGAGVEPVTVLEIVDIGGIVHVTGLGDRIVLDPRVAEIIRRTKVLENWIGILNARNCGKKRNETKILSLPERRRTQTRRRIR